MDFIGRLIMPISRRWMLVVSVVALLSILAAWSLSRLRIENDLMFMLPDDNRVKVFYQDMEERFGSSAGIAIAISSSGSIYNYDLLKRIGIAGDRIKQANLRIPADKIRLILDSGIEQALLVASYLNSRILEGASASELGSEFLDAASLSQSLTDAFPFFLDQSQMESICSETARLVSDKAASDGRLASRLIEAVTSPKDRRGRIRGLWVEDVVSIAETDTVWPELESKASLHCLFRDYHLKITPDLDAFLDHLVERGFRSAEGLLSILAPESRELEEAGFPLDFIETLRSLIDINSAEEIIKEIRIAPKQIRVGPLMQRADALDKRALSFLRERLKAWPIFDGILRSSDEKSTLILVRTAPNLDKENRALLLLEIKRIISDVFGGSGFEVHIAGEPVIDEEVADLMTRDVKRLLPIVIAIVTLILAASFRSVAGVAYPMITVLLSLLWCLGTMAWLDAPISVVSTVIPVLMVAVGSAYGIHIVHETIRESLHEPDRVSAVSAALRIVGRGVLVAGATTIAGFASLGFNPIVPLRDFGIFIAAGILFALLISFYLIPSPLVRFGGKVTGERTARTGSMDRISGRLLDGIVGASSRHPWIVLLSALFLFGAGAAGIASLKVEVNNITFFKKDAPIRKADSFINENFSGTVSLNVVFEGKKRYAVLDESVLKVFDTLSDEIKSSNPEVGKAISVTDFIKKMNKTFNFNDPSFYRLSAASDLEGEKGEHALIRHYASYLDKYPRKDIRPYIDEEKKTAVLQFQEIS